MDNDYLLNISIIDAIGWPTILTYLLLLVVEITACIFLTSRIDKERQKALRLRVLGLMLGLFFVGFFLQTPELYCLWFIVVVATTGVFANTKLGFANDEMELTPRIKITREFRNLVVWLTLAVLSFSLGIGSNILGVIVRGPEVAQKEVWYVSAQKDGSLSLGFKEGDWGLIVHVTNDYESYFSEGDCLELTYYQPYDPFGYLENFATKIQRSESCE